jgi:hypothetical protein
MAHSEKIDQIIASSLIDSVLLEKLRSGEFEACGLELSAEEEASLKTLFVQDEGALSQNIINVVNWFTAHYANTAPVGYISHVHGYVQTPYGPQLSLIPITPLVPIHVNNAPTPEPNDPADSTDPADDTAPTDDTETPDSGEPSGATKPNITAAAAKAAVAATQKGGGTSSATKGGGTSSATKG